MKRSQQPKKSQTRLMSCQPKANPKEAPDNILITSHFTFNSHPWIMFSFRFLVIIWRGGFGCLKNWTIFMDVINVSSLILFSQGVLSLKKFFRLLNVKSIQKRFPLKHVLFFIKLDTDCPWCTSQIDSWVKNERPRVQPYYHIYLSKSLANMIFCHENTDYLVRLVCKYCN